MPIYVVCPNQCRVRMPVNRMGQIVRCPECKSTIRVPQISASRMKRGGQIFCRAELVAPKTDPVSPHSKPESDDTEVTPLPPARLPVLDIQHPPKQAHPPKQSQPSPEPPKQLPQPTLKPIAPEVTSPPSKPAARIPEMVSKSHDPVHLVPIIQPPVNRPPSASIPSNVELEISVFTDGNRDEVPETPNWQSRLEQANSDRRVLARFLALCLCFVAIVNMAPAIYHWIHWTQTTDSLPLPRWIYILVFVGAIHLVYAFFLAQIPDWSALRAISIAMLIVAFVFGIVSTGLLIGGQGSLTSFLGIPFSLKRQATIWCVAMLCLSTLMSYWSGKESSNWQRAEDLLKNILIKSAA